MLNLKIYLHAHNIRSSMLATAAAIIVCAFVVDVAATQLLQIQNTSFSRAIRLYTNHIVFTHV